MPFVRSPGVCLRKIDYSETSQVLRFFTPEQGKISCIAKGAKRRRGPFLAPFDLLGVYDLIRIEKRPGTLDILTQAETVRVFPRLRADYARFCAASYAAEFTDEFTAEGMKVEGLYERLLELLERLESGRPVPDALFSFEARALGALGYFPRVRECGACRREVRRPEALFSPGDGGALCPDCRPRNERWFRVARASLESIARFGEGDMPKRPLERGLAAEHPPIIDAGVAVHQEREHKSARFAREAIL
jgi:DNA repair protein RecO (recombination protein O)